MFKVGDYAYVDANGWVKVQIIRVTGNYYHVKKVDTNSAFGVTSHRLLSEEEYDKLPKDEPKPTLRPPFLH